MPQRLSLTTCEKVGGWWRGKEVVSRGGLRHLTLHGRGEWGLSLHQEQEEALCALHLHWEAPSGVLPAGGWVPSLSSAHFHGNF